MLGCLILKPQMALLLPVAVLAARQWRAIFGAALSSTGLLLLGVAIFGLAATRAWIDQMPLYVSIARDGLVGWNKLASVYAAARQAGLDAGLAMTLHAVVAAAAAAAVWKIWRSDAEPTCKAAVLIAGHDAGEPISVPLRRGHPGRAVPVAGETEGRPGPARDPVVPADRHGRPDHPASTAR